MIIAVERGWTCTQLCKTCGTDKTWPAQKTTFDNRDDLLEVNGPGTCNCED